MKHTNLEQVRKDLTDLSKNEFETKYPGIKRDEAQGLSDKELEKIAGGACMLPPRKNKA